MSRRGKHQAAGLQLDPPPAPAGAWDREQLWLGPRRLLSLVGSALRLVWRTSPSETIRLLVLQVLAGVVLPLQVLVGKWALDSILAASRAGSGMDAVLPAVAVALAAMTAGQILTACARDRERLLPHLAAQAAKEMLAEKAVALDLEALETPAFHDRLVRAQTEAAYRPANMVGDLARIVSSSVAVIGLAALLLTIHPLLVAGLAVAMLPLTWASLSGARAYYRMTVHVTPKIRLISYLQGLLTTLDSAKETRAFGLGPYLLGQQRRLFEDEAADLRRLIGQLMGRNIVATLASAVVNTAGVLFILWLHFSQRISLSETIAAAGALLLVLPRMTSLVQALGQLHENALFIEDLWSFLAVQPRQLTLPVADALPSTLTTLRVEDLAFGYPNRDAPVLQGVSIEVSLGETVAIVGENGAGKTTLVKLLCRMYDPDSGTISWDGRDLRTCDPEDLRTQIAVIFQDFVHYELAARENIGFGDIAAMDDGAAIAPAAESAGAAGFLADLPDGYDTRLGRRFENGHELSIGQWQRLALARAFFRNAPLVIMDEPTASLDARAESELFEVMRRLFCDRAVLLISHRFSSVRMADRIYVLRDGAIAETGTHDELISADGLYAELFNLQAAAYTQHPSKHD